MLFLHGYDASREAFSYQLEYFSRYFKVYAPDLPGFKKPLPYPYGIGDYALSLKKFIEASGEKDFCVLAHSFGARIVLKLAPDYSFKKIVFTGAAGLKTKKSPSYFFKKWGYRSIKRVFGEKAAEFYAKKHIKNGIYDMPLVKRQSFIKIVNETLDDKLDFIKSPTLLVWGREDKETPPYLAKRFKEKLKLCELVFLEGGHFVFIDDYLSFNIIVKEFLTR